jgi:thioredoxin 1
MTGKKVVQEITEDNFSEFVNSEQKNLVIVDFFASWCGSCVMMAPVLDKLAEKYQGKVKFLKLDVDNAPKLSQEYEISSIPCIVFFQAGEEVDRVVGAVGSGTLDEKIGDYLRL